MKNKKTPEKFTQNIISELTEFLEVNFDELVQLTNLNVWEGKINPDPEGIIARNAIQTLGIWGKYASSSVNTLQKYLKTNQYHIFTEDILDTLGKIGYEAKAAIPEIASYMLIKDHSSIGRNYEHYNAAIALGLINSQDAVPYLIEAIQDPNNQGPCWRALVSLGRLGAKSRSALPTLYNTFNSPEFHEYQRDMIKTITKIGPPNGKNWIIVTDFIKKQKNHQDRDHSIAYLCNMVQTSDDIEANALDFFLSLPRQVADPDICQVLKYVDTKIVTTSHQFSQNKSLQACHS
ncbi:MAG: hypothetical protein Q3M24_14750 [Candidatus Electrothrix aestuarii]|uniref:HEAT repeat-containing protein n=1 Tax=Candidatus Electrothrix aestuarii TaxID=3062594 RepID=A0AAU8LQL3_9BACT|nr:HEAT repeat domain-containing protein [Candidatus Electrothrix aestuarii]